MSFEEGTVWRGGNTIIESSTDIEYTLFYISQFIINQESTDQIFEKLGSSVWVDLKDVIKFLKFFEEMQSREAKNITRVTNWSLVR